MKAILLFGFLALAPFAHALNTDDCPQSFSIGISNISVYASSVYSDVPGWKESRDNLALYSHGAQGVFTLDSKTSDKCYYTSTLASRALISSYMNKDESNNEYSVNFLAFDFSLGDFSYNLFHIIETISTDGITLFYGSPNERKKIDGYLTKDSAALRVAPVGLVRVDIL